MTIDFGEWATPMSWDDITLGQFQEMTSLENNDDILDVLPIILGKTKEEVMQLPVEFMDAIMDGMGFLQEKPIQGEPTNKIEIDGEVYSIAYMEKMKTGEYLAVDNVLRSDPSNLAAILAILCRREGEVYDSDFEANKFNERLSMFKGVSITKVLPLTAFFLELSLVSSQVSLLYSKVREEIGSTRSNIQSLQDSGGVTRRSTRSAMKALRKLEERLNAI